MLASLLDEYKKNTNLELELRFKSLSKDNLVSLIQNVKGDSYIEQTINFIAPGNKGNRIGMLKFVNGVKKDASWITKNRIKTFTPYESQIPYKISLSSEDPIDKFNYDISQLARIKLRYSIMIKDMPGWRLDITLVKHVTDIVNSLKHDKNAMLFKIDIDNFIEKAPWKYANSYEVEVEYIGTEPDVKIRNIEKLIDYIMAIVKPNYKETKEYNSYVYKIAEFVFHNNKKKLDQYKQGKSIKGIYNRVWELNKKNFYKNVYNDISNFYLLDKADGIRALCLIEVDGQGSLYLIELANGIKKTKIPNTEEDLSKNGKPYIFTIFDAEFINDKYYVFDVLVYDGKSIVDKPTHERVKHIPNIIKLAGARVIHKKMISLTDTNFNSEIKSLWDSNEKPYEVDGLIFTPKDAMYLSMRSWKWKPMSHMSIDFMVKKPPGKLLGIHPYIKKEGHELLFLFVGIDKSRYDNYKLFPVQGYKTMFPNMALINKFPIQFSPSDTPYAYIYHHPHNSNYKLEDIIDNVCEFRRKDFKSFEGGNEHLKDVKIIPWDIMRIRTDRAIDISTGKYFGNDFYVAEYTWDNYSNPLLFSDLIVKKSELMDKGYFQEEKRPMYKHMAGFNSFVKSNLISQYSESDWLVDLASGKGQDMFRVSEYRIKNALYMDKDEQALSELLSRKYDYQRGIRKMNTRIHTKKTDLTQDYNEIIQSIKNIGIPVGIIDVVMCNFAIHYLTGTDTHILNVLQLVKTLLKDNGCFFFTSFNGKAVFNLLKDKKINESWDCMNGETTQYSIRKKYKSDAMENVGQAIEVLLPFSEGKYYQEFLVNYDYIQSLCKLLGLVVVRTGHFKDFLDGFKSKNAKVYSALTENDKAFISLYSFMVIKKKPDKNKHASLEEEQEKNLHKTISK